MPKKSSLPCGFVENLPGGKILQNFREALLLLRNYSVAARREDSAKLPGSLTPVEKLLRDLPEGKISGSSPGSLGEEDSSKLLPEPSLLCRNFSGISRKGRSRYLFRIFCIELVELNHLCCLGTVAILAQGKPSG